MPVAEPAVAVDQMLGILANLLPGTGYDEQLQMARTAVLDAVVHDAQTTGGRRLSHYADQLDDVDTRITQWMVATRAAELCTLTEHFERFCDDPGAAALWEHLDAHVRAHLRSGS